MSVGESILADKRLDRKEKLRLLLFINNTNVISIGVLVILKIIKKVLFLSKILIIHSIIYYNNQRPTTENV